MKTPSPQPAAGYEPGLIVRYRYLNGEASHIRRFSSREQQLATARHMAELSHCAAVDLCKVKPPHGLLTGCKTFDSQLQLLITGNVISNTLLGQCIRPRQELSCNGYTWKPSELQRADLKAFAQFDQQGILSRWISTSPHFESDGGICYLILHWRRVNGRDRPVIHGALITDRHCKRLATFDARDLHVNGSSKARLVMQAVTPFLTDEIVTEAQPFYRAAVLA